MIFYPFLHASVFGRGDALKPSVRCGSYETSTQGSVPVLDVSAVLNEEKKELTVFVLNRSVEDSIDLSMQLFDFGASFVPKEHIAYEGYALNAVNSLEKDDVTPVSRQDIRVEGEVMKVDLCAASCHENMYHLMNCAVST